MTELIVDNIVNSLKSLDYITRIGGLVTPIRIKEKKEYRLPCIRNTEKSDCNPSEYIDFIPDDKETLMLFFEEQGSAGITATTSDYYDIEHRIRAVVWLNSKLFGEQTYKARYEIMQNIPRTIADITPLNTIRVDLTGIPEKDPALFEKYGFETTKSQYLIYPYDYFALDYSIKYRLPLTCNIELLRSPESC